MSARELSDGLRRLSSQAVTNVTKIEKDNTNLDIEFATDVIKEANDADEVSPLIG